MPGTESKNLLDEGAHVTSSNSLKIILDILKNLWSQGKAPIEFKFDTEKVSLNCPEVTIVEVSGSAETLFAFDHPEDRKEEDLLLEFKLIADLVSENEILLSLQATEQKLEITARARPYYSPSKGIGLVIYQFKLDILESKPMELDPFLKNIVADEIKKKLVPKITGIQDKLFSLTFQQTPLG